MPKLTFGGFLAIVASPFVIASALTHMGDRPSTFEATMVQSSSPAPAEPLRSVQPVSLDRSVTTTRSTSPAAAPALSVSGRRLYTRTGANVRYAPSTDAAKVRTLAPGTALEELSRSGPWVEVADADDNRLGWISANLLVDQPPGEPTAERTEPKARKPATVAAPPTVPRAAIVARLISQSRAGYGGSCGCPDDVDRGGRRCGGRSAYSRAGGRSMICYASDVTAAMVAAAQ